MKEKDIWANALIKEAENLIDLCLTFTSSGSLNIHEDVIEIYEGIEKDYKQFLNEFGRFKEEYDVNGVYIRDVEEIHNISQSKGKMVANFHQMLGQLRKAKTTLEGMKEVTFEKEEEEKLTEIENEIDELRPVMAVIAEDLKKGLDEIRSGHFLSSAMITGRVIDHIIDEIKSEEGLGSPDEVIEFIKNDDLVEEADSHITEAVKKYRNVYAHEVGKNPDFKNCSILLFGTINLLQKIEDAEMVNDYNLR